MNDITFCEILDLKVDVHSKPDPGAQDHSITKRQKFRVENSIELVWIFKIIKHVKNMFSHFFLPDHLLQFMQNNVFNVDRFSCKKKVHIHENFSN